MMVGVLWLHKSDIETSHVKLSWGDMRMASVWEYGFSPVGVLKITRDGGRSRQRVSHLWRWEKADSSSEGAIAKRSTHRQIAAGFGMLGQDQFLGSGSV
jgi:hypothetical protein